MKVASILAVARALQEAEVKYLVVGGVAVNLYGHQRATKDLDLVIGLEEENIRKGIRVLKSVGYQPKLPVDGEEFAREEVRKEWVEGRNMVVFQWWSDVHRETPIDVFVAEPFEFGQAYERAVWEEWEGVKIPVVPLNLLMDMKKEAGRGQDLSDLEKLEEIRYLRERG
ncbi:MAG: hypothetical protein AAGC74_09735 [Verrucomicrobiota bacterium]